MAADRPHLHWILTHPLQQPTASSLLKKKLSLLAKLKNITNMHKSVSSDAMKQAVNDKINVDSKGKQDVKARTFETTKKEISGNIESKPSVKKIDEKINKLNKNMNIKNTKPATKESKVTLRKNHDKDTNENNNVTSVFETTDDNSIKNEKNPIMHKTTLEILCSLFQNEDMTNFLPEISTILATTVLRNSDDVSIILQAIVYFSSLYKNFSTIVIPSLQAHIINLYKINGCIYHNVMLYIEMILVGLVDGIDKIKKIVVRMTDCENVRVCEYLAMFYDKSKRFDVCKNDIDPITVDKYLIVDHNIKDIEITLESEKENKINTNTYNIPLEDLMSYENDLKRFMENKQNHQGNLNKICINKKVMDQKYFNEFMDENKLNVIKDFIITNLKHKKEFIENHYEEVKRILNIFGEEIEKKNKFMKIIELEKGEFDFYLTINETINNGLIGNNNVNNLSGLTLNNIYLGNANHALINNISNKNDANEINTNNSNKNKNRKRNHFNSHKKFINELNLFIENVKLLVKEEKENKLLELIEKNKNLNIIAKCVIFNETITTKIINLLKGKQDDYAVLFLCELSKFGKYPKLKIIRKLENFLKNKNFQNIFTTVESIGRFYLASEEVNYEMRCFLQKLKEHKNECNEILKIEINSCLSRIINRKALDFMFNDFLSFIINRERFNFDGEFGKLITKEFAIIIFMKPWLYSDLNFVVELIRKYEIYNEMLKLIYESILICLFENNKNKCFSYVKLYAHLIHDDLKLCKAFFSKINKLNKEICIQILIFFVSEIKCKLFFVDDLKMLVECRGTNDDKVMLYNNHLSSEDDSFSKSVNNIIL